MRSALAISLTLHAILLWQVLDATSGALTRMQTSPRPEALKAILHSASEAPSPLPVPQRLPEPPQRSTNTIAITSPSPIAEVAAMAPVPLPAKTLPTVTNEPRSIMAPPSASSISENTGLDANGLRHYRVNLAVAARRFRNFPVQALASGLSGTAEVRVTISANGMPQPPQLERSSGHDLLDAAALQMLGNALQNAHLPESLQGRSFSLRLPVEFGVGESIQSNGK